jgi:hypothetical protein
MLACRGEMQRSHKEEGVGEHKLRRDTRKGMKKGQRRE